MSEIRSGRGIRAFLGHLNFWLDPAPGLERLALIEVNWYGMLHVLNLFFSVPVGPYSIEKHILYFSGKLPLERLPPVADLHVDTFTVWRAICAVLREDP